MTDIRLSHPIFGQDIICRLSVKRSDCLNIGRQCKAARRSQASSSAGQGDQRSPLLGSRTRESDVRT
jgi:hypothetical protein